MTVVARATCRSASSRDSIERTFRQVANDKGLDFDDRAGDERCRATIHTDPTRLQQVLKNLLANAFKFTEKGGVTLQIEPVDERLAPGHDDARPRRRRVIAFSVADTGIGIPDEKQRIIFEAFQQADASTTPQVRRHGPRPLDQPRDRAPARRRDPAWRASRAWARPSRSTCRRPTSRPSVAARAARRRSAPTTSRPGRSSRQATAERSAVAAPDATCRRRRRGRADSGHRGAGCRRPRHHRHRATASVLIVEDDVNFARILLDMARDKGFKGHRRDARRDRPLHLAQRVPPRRHHARHRAARHGRVDGARPSQARPRHAPHPGAHHLRRGGDEPRPAPRAPSRRCRSR